MMPIGSILGYCIIAVGIIFCAIQVNINRRLNFEMSRQFIQQSVDEEIKWQEVILTADPPFPEGEIGWRINNKNMYLLGHKLNQALRANSYEERIKQNILASHPEINLNELSWLFIEFKRFLMLNELLRVAPVYSERIDLVWKEAIRLTDDYECFCIHFAGRTIHRGDNTFRVHDSAARAIYENVYSYLFVCRAENRFLLGEFINPIHTLPAKFKKDLSSSGNHWIREKHFNNAQCREVSCIINHLIVYFKIMLNPSIPTIDDKTWSEIYSM
ncbi:MULTISPECIES: hypothetical protein [Paenibacillus]|uniref:hypothetical protein n=2 Tax=Paenibacillus TaxID=44249 RepID=UPI0009CC3ADB|nr:MULTISPECIES: hypothetical protein [Paenibacillus]MCZ1267400.1 hypothetical protein [Paenibacillus tundrae]SLK16694.1 hypothetical protein SAMN06272722_110224 [Paenibacillus sp. RU5A]SOC74438.1 hypothetical protein SAMN05880581_110224 [Paenibacillus sp. RU26A]SOC76611.1 hypothetical protein SAMN05880586_110224 [Paenibacillus sp. RU5M]